MNNFTRRVVRMRAPYTLRTLLNDSVSAKQKKIGIIGMGKVGTVVANNLLRNSYNLQSIIDIDLEKCQGEFCIYLRFLLRQRLLIQILIRIHI